MSDQDEELRGDALMRYAWKWIKITEGIEKADAGPLVQYLRSGDPIAKEVRKLLADLFDPDRPIGVYAEIVLLRGRKSEDFRNYKLYEDCEAWKYDNKLDHIPHKQWEKFRAKYKIASVVAAKAAHLKGRAISDKISRDQ